MPILYGFLGGLGVALFIIAELGALYLCDNFITNPLLATGIFLGGSVVFIGTVAGAFLWFAE